MSPETCCKILGLREQKLSYSSIAKAVGRSKAACQRVCECKKSTGYSSQRPRSGRPPKTIPKIDRLIHRQSERNRKLTAVDISGILSEHYGIHLTPRTVRYKLAKFGLQGRVARKKPYISETNRRKRLQWAKEHVDWSEADWEKVLWTDESKFMKNGSEGRIYVRRRKDEEFHPKCTQGTVKGSGGSVMVWGAMSANGPGALAQVHGIMDRFAYVDILKTNLENYADENMPLNWCYQQDNDPKHTSNHAKKYFREKKINVLDWPPQSADLNPIENCWNYIGNEIRKLQIGDLKQLYPKIEKLWRNLPVSYCRKLVSSMPKRCRAVIKNNGYATKY